MRSNRYNRKVLVVYIILLTCVCHQALSQSWNIAGNANITEDINYLGTKNSTDLVFRTNAFERGRIFGNGGAWCFGSAAYRVKGNKYVFQYANTTNYGLFFNVSPLQYELRNSAATPMFIINASTYKSVFG